VNHWGEYDDPEMSDCGPGIVRRATVEGQGRGKLGDGERELQGTGRRELWRFRERWSTEHLRRHSQCRDHWFPLLGLGFLSNSCTALSFILWTQVMTQYFNGCL
jgi:hypothetical protein